MNETVKSKLEGNTTMLNLQSKRTLPRDVIKWIQGLDLSYSVKDYRKDLNNGFLIGEIISRYEPGKIPMHAFQNSQNQARKDNNWNLLQLFFRKHELRRVKIEDSQYFLIKNNNDSKSEQLYEFICRLFSVCTKRTLPQPNATLDLPPTQSKNPNLTMSYLLKEDGLQKLENSQVSNTSNQQSERHHDDRVPTRKIGPSSNDIPARVDVKGIGLKQQINRKMTSKKKSWEMKTESLYEETNQYVQKYVFDYLNDIIEECLPQQDNSSNQIKTIFSNNTGKHTEILKRNLLVDKNLVLSFFREVKGEINNILTAMLKELNEVWKFFAYFLRMLGSFSEGLEEFASLLDLLSTYATSCCLNEKKKINKVFFESLITILLSEVKNATNWAKRQKIMGIIYDFTGRETEDKKTVLFNLKEKLGSSNPLYISWLAVLIKEQKPEHNSEKLVEDFIYYAHQNLASANSTLRLSALKIINTVCENGWVFLIKDYFIAVDNIRKFRAVSEIEQIYYVNNIYFCLISDLIQSNEYLTLIKGKSQGNPNAIKVYNPDHERQSEELKQRLQLLSLTICKLYFNSNSQKVREIIAKQATNYINDSIPMILILINYLSGPQSNSKIFEDFCEQQKTFYQFKTSRVLINPPNIDQFKQCSNQVLTEMIKVHSLNQDAKPNPNLPLNADMEIKIQNQLHLLQFCLENLNIKKLNMELWNSIAETYFQTIAEFICTTTTQSRTASWAIFCKAYLIYFNYDMKIQELNLYLSQAIVSCSKSESKQNKEMLEGIKLFFEEEYKKGNSEEVRVANEEINQLLSQKGMPEFFTFFKSKQ